MGFDDLNLEIFKAIIVQILVFCIVTSCSLLGGYRCLEENDASTFRVHNNILRKPREGSFPPFLNCPPGNNIVARRSVTRRSPRDSRLYSDRC
jgi:hypothetical protein